MTTSRKRSPKSRYFKMQTQWVKLPAMIDATRGDDTVLIQVFGTRSPHKAGPVAHIYLTPHETHSFASWLCEQADHLIMKRARAEARRAERAAKRAASDPDQM